MSSHERRRRQRGTNSTRTYVDRAPDIASPARRVSVVRIQSVGPGPTTAGWSNPNSGGLKLNDEFS